MFNDLNVFVPMIKFPHDPICNGKKNTFNSPEVMINAVLLLSRHVKPNFQRSNPFKC